METKFVLWKDFMTIMISALIVLITLISLAVNLKIGNVDEAIKDESTERKEADKFLYKLISKDIEDINSDIEKIEK